jgi:ubiquinone/menaquinone biosynthesis C-methylase UbiE
MRPEQLAERYDREARDYRELWAPILHVAARDLVAECARAPAQRVCDVGTGVGTLLLEVRRAFPGATVVGLDRSFGMLRLAPADGGRAVVDAGCLAIRSESADLVLLVFMLFHLEEPFEGVREARRVLRPGGRIGALTWAGELESRATRLWTECLEAHGAAPVDPNTQARHDLVDTPDKMTALLRRAGFRSIDAREQELVYTIGPEHLIRLRTGLGSARPRYDSLDAPARQACVAAARSRMQGLAPGDFVARGHVVRTIAVA